MELLKLYTDTLTAIDLEVKHDRIMVDKETPLKVGNRQFILYGDKGKELLASDPDHYIVFNPLDENRLNGVSQDLSKMIKILAARLNLVIKMMAIGIMTSLDKTAPLALTPLMDELNEAKGNAKVLVDDKLIEYLTQIANNNTLNVVNVKLKHGMIIDGEKELSAIVLSSPMPKLISDENYLPSARKKDRRVIKVLYKWIVDFISGPTGSVGYSHNDDAPDFIAFYKTLVHLSEKTKPISRFIEGSGHYYPLLENDLSLRALNAIPDMMLEAKLIPSVSGTSTSTVVKTSSVENDESGEVRVISTPEELFGAKKNNNSLFGAVTQPMQPVYGQPAPPVYNQPMQPVYGQPAPPVYNQPMQPVYGQPAPPVYNQPMQPVYEKSLFDRLNGR